MDEIDQIIDETISESKGDLIKALDKLAILKYTHRTNSIVSRTVSDVEIGVRLTMQNLQKKLSEIKKKKWFWDNISIYIILQKFFENFKGLEKQLAVQPAVRLTEQQLSEEGCKVSWFLCGRGAFT